MISFGKKITFLRKGKELSQTDLSNQLSTSVSVISRYGRDEMTQSIDASKKLANLLDTTVGYLLGESEDSNLFKDPSMLERFNLIRGFKKDDQERLLFTIDAMIHEVSNRKRYANK